MALADRFQAAFQSHVGMLLLGLVGFLGLLMVAYLVLMAIQKRRDILASYYRHYYEKAEALAEGFRFVGLHKAEFFGRQTVVQQDNQTYSMCVIPPPKIAVESTLERFAQYQEATQHQKIPVLVPQTIRLDQSVIIVLQHHLLTPDGKYLENLRQMGADGRLGPSEVEFVLLELAGGLAALHDLHGANGEPLYHGFLSPRSIYLTQEANKTVTGVLLADAGFAYAMGGGLMADRLAQLREGKLVVDRYTARALLKELPMIAPEIRNPNPAAQVGPAADFFSFAALAVTLFTSQTFAGADRVDWERIPERWRSFLKPCLNQDPSKRPKDFLELQDWLNDPELALTHQEKVNLDAQEEPSLAIEADESLRGLMDKIKGAKKQQGKDSSLIQRASQLVTDGNWDSAKTLLEEALKETPEDVEVLLQLAITCHELGDQEGSERYYRQVKSLNPVRAKAFREHLAFRV